ncbi:MAG: DUF4340 domain-containing protein [Bacteroidota bacterium]
MNRTLILLIAVVVLGGGTYFLTSQEQAGPVTSIAGADRDFAVDRELVEKIFIADRQGHRTTLERNGEGWTYNEKYVARPDAVEILLQTIDKIRMRFKPTEAAVPHMVETLATQGIKVEIYGKEDELLKAYYIGGATNDERGTYIILEGAEQPYVADIPNWEGNLRFRYNLRGDDWRDRSILKAEAEEIAAVSIEYPKQQNSSFRLEIGEESKVTPYYPLTPKINAPVQAGRVDAFIHNFNALTSASFTNFRDDYDQIIAQVPFAVISVEKKDGSVQSLKLWPVYPDAALDPKTGINMAPDEVLEYHALTENGDLMEVYNEMVKKILWSYEFFF